MARHQVTELPPVEPKVVEYQCHTITCLACEAQNRAEWLSDRPAGSLGRGFEPRWAT